LLSDFSSLQHDKPSLLPFCAMFYHLPTPITTQKLTRIIQK
jgi:hypothetical protein